MTKVLLFLGFCSSYALASASLQTLAAIQDALQNADWQKAERLISDELSYNPKDGGVLNLRGVLHARKNEIAEARKDFGEAVQMSPQLTAAWRNLGRACRQLDQISCALDAWKRVAVLNPVDKESHGSLASLYEEQGKFAESLAQLNAGKIDDPALLCLDLSGLGRMPEAKKVAARLALRSDFSEEELASLHGPLDSPKAAGVIAALVEGLDLRGVAGAPSLRRLVVAYEHMGQIAKARKVLERVAKLDPADTSHLLELARLAEIGKDFEGALGYLAHARDLDPDNAHIHFLFGSVAGELNLPVEAKASLDKALEKEPENPNYNFAMGSVILKTRDAASAASYFEKFVKANPADASGHYALGLAYFSSGDYAKAKEQMKLAEAGPAVAARAEYYLGRISRLEGDLDAAAILLRQSVQREPALPDPHTELGRIALAKGNLAEAHAELARAIALAPDNFQANEQLLVLYKRTHDSRAPRQAESLKKLDEERSRRAELMLRTVEIQR